MPQRFVAIVQFASEVKFWGCFEGDCVLSVVVVVGIGVAGSGCPRAAAWGFLWSARASVAAVSERLKKRIETLLPDVQPILLVKWIRYRFGLATTNLAFQLNEFLKVIFLKGIQFIFFFG